MNARRTPHTPFAWLLYGSLCTFLPDNFVLFGSQFLFPIRLWYVLKITHAVFLFDKTISNNFLSMLELSKQDKGERASIITWQYLRSGEP